MSDSGNSSKFDVSSMLLISMEMAAGLSLRKEGKCETLVYLKPFQMHFAETHQRQPNEGYVTWLLLGMWLQVIPPLRSCHHTCKSWRTKHIPDVFPVHRLKEGVTLHLLNAHSTNTVLSVITVPEMDSCCWSTKAFVWQEEIHCAEIKCLLHCSLILHVFVDVNGIILMWSFW